MNDDNHRDWLRVVTRVNQYMCECGPLRVIVDAEGYSQAAEEFCAKNAWRLRRGEYVVAVLRAEELHEFVVRIGDPRVESVRWVRPA